MASVNSSSPAAPPASGAQGDNAYPDQRHAGAVGLGPDYGKGVTTGDKFDGLKEEAKGKMFRKPDLVQHGKELRTGELKKRKEAEDNDTWQNPADKAGDDSHAGATSDQVPKSDDNQHASMPPGVPDTSHPTEKGRMQQAATVAPEASDDAESQKSGVHNYRSIG